MALVRGCHAIGVSDPGQAPWMAQEILKKGLLVDTAKHGTAAWAYHVDMVPTYWEHSPMVIFEVDEQYVIEINNPLPKKKDFAFMKMPGTLFSYIPITVLGFVNLPGLSSYPKNAIGFF